MTYLQQDKPPDDAVIVKILGPLCYIICDRAKPGSGVISSRFSVL